MDRKSVNVRSYANIAIIKYWGKKDTVEMIPATSSISLTLENMYTETSLSSLPASAQSDEFYINGILQDQTEHKKMGEIIDRFRPAGYGFVRIDRKIICRQQQGYLLAQAVYLPSLRHAMNFLDYTCPQNKWRKKQN